MSFDVTHNHEVTNHSIQSGFNMDPEGLKREHSFSNQVDKSLPRKRGRPRKEKILS